MGQTSTFDGRLYLGGEWRRGRGAEIASHFPADGSLISVRRRIPGPRAL